MGDDREFVGLLSELERLRARVACLEAMVDATRQEEAALQGEGEGFYHAVLQNAPYGAIVASRSLEGRCLWANAEFTRITGYSLLDVPTVGAWMERAYPDPAYRQVVLDNWERDVSPEQMRRDVVYRVTCKDRTERPIQLRATLLDDERIIVMVVDLSERERADAERRRLEARMQKAQKMHSLGLLAGGVAHDFNNLLVGIMGHAELARVELPPGSRAAARIDEIVAAAERAADLARQMLVYAGQARLETRVVDLRSLAEEIGRLLEVSVSRKARLELRFDGEGPFVRGDPTQLRQVLMNLVTNSSEAVGDRAGTISVRGGYVDCARDALDAGVLGEDLPEGRYAFVEVKDDGGGMDEETLARIFDPFFTTKLTGRGLGLAAVHGIVRRHGGGILVDSEPGRGTTFRVILPAASPGTPDEEEPAAERHFRGSGAVLVVDDDPVVRVVLHRMLGRLGFEVTLAADGAEAIALLESTASAFVCVVLDLVMPRRDGGEVLRVARACAPDLPVLVSTGCGDADVERRLDGLEPAGLIAKPFTLDQLAQALDRILGKICRGGPEDG